ncbi:protein atonal homolog 8 [Sipha flava]|uniref:Protein atonal 8 n=1 Tax=Sipha flava TaxID=143950 RepID=A0A2S2Q7Z7_9HEMI|nr:protein atonal homolog 8 [Sipha flava]
MLSPTVSSRIMVTSRIALDGLLQNRLTPNICKDTLHRIHGGETDLFHLYAGKHNTDDTSSSSCGADTMTAAAIKRETHTPTTDQSEDSGVDVSVAGGGGGGGNNGEHHGRPYKRRRSGDESDDGDDGCPAKSSRTKAAVAATTTTATETVLSVNMAACPPFRPWSSDESSSDVGLRLFQDIRNVDRILTLTQRRREPPAEPQPLDLTKGRANVALPVRPVDLATTAERQPVELRGRTAIANECCSATGTTGTTAIGTTAGNDACTATTTATTRYSKNMSRARRIEANARERSRVHTISAAFDTLRATIPSYSRNQKLSKLSTIRIASAYILTLSRLLDMDYSAEQDRPSVAECVDNVTGIIHMEGKARKRKDEQQ